MCRLKNYNNIGFQEKTPIFVQKIVENRRKSDNFIGTSSRAARFFFFQITKKWKNIPNDHKAYLLPTEYTKWQQKFQFGIKYTSNFDSRPRPPYIHIFTLSFLVCT
jgi:hypothetical protein